ncbi:MAG: V-type ATP synthase subunit E [Candidatus Odinarchaeum yellowstonii]|uniref:A-type ATP synthase subunit E n=1 Tax=Odinarchaeota yellowstonii (strain LCB_4) TaxID=1841599 RepID=A0AAF0IDS4_ODILC|nr:MAG: V-type ATP synthase subunit E [Candidatus Odinarchaeum yellowstonii]
MLTQTEPLQFIKNKILNDGQLKATAIVNKAKEDYEKALKEFEENIKRRYETLLENAKSEANQIIERKIAETKVYVNRIILDKKEELIEKAFTKAFEILKNMIKTEKYKKFIENSIYSTAKYIGGGDLTVYVNKETVIEPQTLDKIAEKVTKELGVKTTIKLGKERIQAVGGIIMKNREGDIEVNNTIETLIENAKNTIRSKVAKTLFTS